MKVEILKKFCSLLSRGMTAALASALLAGVVTIVPVPQPAAALAADPPPVTVVGDGTSSEPAGTGTKQEALESGEAPTPSADSVGILGETVTSPYGDTLAVTNVRTGAVFGTAPNQWAGCDNELLYGGKVYLICGYSSLYDATWNDDRSTTSNSAEHELYDECGQLVSTGYSFGWYTVGSNPPSIGSGWHHTGVQQLTAQPGMCFGEWRVIYTWTQTFNSGATLTASHETTLLVYPDQASAVAAQYSQATPTGGPVQAVEQLGGCGCGYPTHAQATRFPIDTASGNFWHTFHELAIPGRGPTIDLSRTYNSLAATADGPFGFGWTDPYSMSLSVLPSTATLYQGNGAQATFTLNGSAWSAPPRVQASLVHNGDGTWTVTRAAREILIFDASGRLTGIRDLNGYTTTVTYPTPSTRVVTDPAGRTLTFTLTGGHVTSVTDSSSPPRSLTYSYDGAGNLTDVIDVGGGHWQFTYDSSHRMLTMRSPRFFGDTTTSPSPVVTNHYDSQGRIDWQSDQLGRVTSFDYDSIAGSTKVTDPKGNVVVYGYQDGLLVSEERGYGTTKVARRFYRYDPDTTGPSIVIDPNGQVTRTTYDPAGNPLTVTDPLWRTTTFTYNALRQVTSVTEPKRVNGQPITRSMTYDPAGNVLTASAPLLDADGTTTATATTTYGYDDPSHPGDVTSVTDPNTNRISSTYDTYGNLTSVTPPPTAENPAGNRTTFGYDPVRGWRTSMVSPRGNIAGAEPADFTTTIAYDAYGRPTVTRDPLWTAAAPTAHQTISHYDADGNLDSSTDGNNRTTTSTYNPAGEETEVRRADGSVLRTEYWPDGSIRRHIDGANQATSYDYDPLGNPSSVTDPLNRVTASVHDGAGNLLTVTNPSGRRTTHGYDAAAQLTSLTYSDGVTPNVTNMTYDANGQRTAMTDGTGTSTWAWDTLHRLTGSTSGAGQTVAYGYDLGGRTISLTYPGTTGTVIRSYDAADRLTGVRDWANRLTTFGYDPDSNLVSQTYPNGTRSAVSVDEANRMMGISHAPTANPNSPFAAFTYGRDGAGLLASTTSTGVPADNHTWTHNQLNQLTGVDTATYGYDPADNLAVRLDGTTQAYDAANQLNVAVTAPISLVGSASAGGATSTSLAITLPVGTAANDQVIVAATLPNGKTVNTPSGYTLVGTYTSGTSNTAAKVVVFRRTVVAGDTSVTVPFQGKFDKTVTLVVHRNVHPTTPVDVANSGFTAGGPTVTAPSVTASLAGERLLMITGASGTKGTWTTPTGMLTPVQRASGSTDGAIADQPLAAAGPTGGRTSTHSTSTQLVGVLVALRPAGTSYTYDLQGNRTSVTAPTGTPVSHTYDQANRLSAYGTTATYTYNGDGLRMSKTVSGVTSAFTWDVAEGLPLLLADGTTNYVYGPGGLPLEQITSSGVVSYYHHDQLGSTRALTNSSGAVVATYTYDPYGKLTASTGTATNPFGYAGQYTDTETGYQYLRARYYDPATAQFLTRDPIEAQTREPYGYVGGNPLNATDPLGLCSINPFAGDNCIGAGLYNLGALIDGPVDKALEANIGPYDLGTFGAGLFNLGYGSFKIQTGTAALLATPVAASIPFIGPVTGTAAAAYGTYQVGSGSARVIRGIGQVGFGPEMVDCEEDQTLGANLRRFGGGIVPGRGVIDFIGGWF